MHVILNRKMGANLYSQRVLFDALKGINQV